MSTPTLEDRVAALERRVAQLTGERIGYVCASCGKDQPKHYYWYTFDTPTKGPVCPTCAREPGVFTKGPFKQPVTTP